MNEKDWCAKQAVKEPSSRSKLRLPSLSEFVSGVEADTTREGDFTFSSDPCLPTMEPNPYGRHFSGSMLVEDIFCAQTLVKLRSDSPEKRISDASSFFPYSPNSKSLPSLFSLSPRSTIDSPEFNYHGNSRFASGPVDLRDVPSSELKITAVVNKEANAVGPVNTSPPSFLEPSFQGPRDITISPSAGYPSAEISPRTRPISFLSNPHSNYSLDTLSTAQVRQTDRFTIELPFPRAFAAQIGPRAERVSQTLSEMSTAMTQDMRLLPASNHAHNAAAMLNTPPDSLEGDDDDATISDCPRIDTKPKTGEVSTGYPDNWECAFEEDCTLGRGVLPRKVVSHFFGRNKLPTKRIPAGLWVYFCRQHYQRMRYRQKSQNGWHLYRCNLLWQQLDRFIGGMGDIRWTIQWIAGSQRVMRQYRARGTQSLDQVSRASTNAESGVESETSQSAKRKRDGTTTGYARTKRHRGSSHEEVDDHDDMTSPMSEGGDDDRAIQEEELVVAIQLDRLCGRNKTNQEVRQFLEMSENFLKEEKISRLLPFEFLPVKWGQFQTD